MKVAVYGGSFNPIHYGHLLSAVWVLEKLNYDKIILVPTNIPVHKSYSDFPLPCHRLKMTELAVEGFDYLEVSDVEIQRGGNSYTIDTVREFKDKLNLTEKLGVIIGDDLLDGLHKWKKIDNLCLETELICLKRNNCSIIAPYPMTLLDNRVINISSTDIRDRIRNGRKIDFLLPDKVKDYINRHKLYIDN